MSNRIVIDNDTIKIVNVLTGTGIDTGAVHLSTAAEISTLTEKVSPVGADLIIIEDSAASNGKKKVQLSNLAGSGDMTKVVYDSAGKEANVYDMDNMDESATKKILTSTERTAISNATSAISTVTEFISGLIEAPADQDYVVLRNAPFAGTITQVTTKSSSGTCTLTGYVNAVGLGGTANSVSVSEAIQAHSSSNTFVAGDDIKITVSANSTCVNMEFTIEYTRSLL